MDNEKILKLSRKLVLTYLQELKSRGDSEGLSTCVKYINKKTLLSRELDFEECRVVIEYCEDRISKIQELLRSKNSLSQSLNS